MPTNKGKRKGIETVFNDVLNYLSDSASAVPARDAEKSVLKVTGLYSIFVDDPGNLPCPFKEYLNKRQLPMVYLGKALDRGLRQRLVEEDLRGKNHSTFFRGIGAILGFLPPEGSLVEKSNQNNYKFIRDDTNRIIRWVNDHLSIRCIELDLSDIENYEPTAIRILRPPLNTKHNPEALPELARLRRRCREIALRVNPKLRS